MRTVTSRFAPIAVALALAAAVAGCGQTNATRDAKAPVDPHDIITVPVYPALHGTIGEYAVFVDGGPLPVEGWGIVANLPGTGSGDMSPEVRAILTEQLYREGLGSYNNGTEKINPEHILASNQIAAVEVRGIIPPLARRGETFDLSIRAIADTQTTSLSGGLLWTSNLKVIGLRTDVDTEVIAQGRGPVFIPAAVAQSAATQPSSVPKAMRSGIVIGGGTCSQSRLVRLQLLTPSFRIVGAIERAINSRFPQRDKTATIEGEATLSLNIPAEYDNAPADFIAVVRHMFLEQEVPGFTERKAAELVRDLADPKAPHRDLSIALQALGRAVVPDYLEPLYTSTSPEVRFWAGRAGAALDDVGGLVVLEEFANGEPGTLRDEAVESIVAISHSGDTIRATLSLMRLVNSKQNADRIEGYTGLVKIGSRAIRTYDVSQKFLLDIVPSDGPPLIYATQTGTPRIALIGHDLRLPKGAFYVSPDNLLTINVADAQPPSTSQANASSVLTASALPGSADSSIPNEADLSGTAAAAPPDAKNNKPVVIYWRSPIGDRTVNLTSPAGLTDVLIHLAWAPDPRLRGFDPKSQYIGASYQRVVEMLASMCRDQLIDADFALQKSSRSLSDKNGLLDSRPERSTRTQTAPPPMTPPVAPQ